MSKKQNKRKPLMTLVEMSANFFANGDPEDCSREADNPQDNVDDEDDLQARGVAERARARRIKQQER